MADINTPKSENKIPHTMLEAMQMESEKCKSIIIESWDEVTKQHPEDSVGDRFRRFHLSFVRTVMNPKFMFRFFLGVLGLVLLEHLSEEDKAALAKDIIIDK